MKEAKKYKFTIFGEHYTLVSDENEKHVAAAAQAVDDLMTTMAKSLGSHDAKKIAVLAALQFSSRLHHAQAQIDHYETERQRLTATVEYGIALCDLA